MDTNNILRLLHIVGGVIWAGSLILLATMIAPAIRAAGPQGATVMRELMQNRKLPVLLLLVGWTTILSGAVLAWRDAGAMGFAWFQRGAGLVFGIGAVAAILGAIIGGAVNAPKAKQISIIAGAAQSEGRALTDDERSKLSTLQDAIFRSTQVIALLMVIATACMATARNFG